MTNAERRYTARAYAGSVLDNLARDIDEMTFTSKMSVNDRRSIARRVRRFAESLQCGFPHFADLESTINYMTETATAGQQETK